MKHYKIKKMEKDKIYSADDVEKIFRDFIKKDKQIKKRRNTPFDILKRKIFYHERIKLQCLNKIFIKYAIKYCIL